jgi:hypothetical protein
MKKRQSFKQIIFKYWWFWVGLVIFFGILLGILLISGREVKKNEKKKDEKEPKTTGVTRLFNDLQLAAANTELANGIKIEDPKNDWVKFPEGTMQPDGRPDNSNPYPLGWTDLKSLSMGADSQFLYVKFEFWDTFPSEAVVHDSDRITGGCGKINNFTFNNSQGKKDTADLISNISFNLQGNGRMNGIDQNAMISPAGEDAQREIIFQVFSKDGLMAGGPGTDFFLSAYPLSQFNLKLGDVVTFDSSSEFGSEKYHHESLDIILGKGSSKFGDTISYILGSNAYKIIPNLEEKKK